MNVYLNGRMVEPGQAKIAFDDAGFQHGVGLFETMAVYHGRAFKLDRHVARLAESAAALGLSADVDAEGLKEAVRQTIRHNAIDRARLRLTVTPGSLSLLSDAGQGQTEMTVLVVAEAATEYAPEYFEQGIMALIAPAGANPFDQSAGHKTLNYWQRLRTLRQAAAAGAGEAIWLSVTNHLASGAVSNVFLVKGDVLMTPIARGEEEAGSLQAPVLPGVTRGAVMELADELGVPVKRRMLTVEDLLGAEEVFLTNASWHVLPVTRVEREAVGSGRVGPITRRMRAGLLELIERETGEGGGEGEGGGGSGNGVAGGGE